MARQGQKLTAAFRDPDKVYCGQLAPADEWIMTAHGPVATYCCRELGHPGKHQWERKWEERSISESSSSKASATMRRAASLADAGERVIVVLKPDAQPPAGSAPRRSAIPKKS